jgi:myosin heavy subunit
MQAEGKVNTIDDRQQFQQVRKAMEVIELTEQEQEDIFAIVASVLHMGNVGFTEEEGKALILKPECVEAVSKVINKHVLQVKNSKIGRCGYVITIFINLVHKQIVDELRGKVRFLHIVKKKIK